MLNEVLLRRGTRLVRRLRLEPGEALPWHRDPYHRVSVVMQRYPGRLRTNLADDVTAAPTIMAGCQLSLAGASTTSQSSQRAASGISNPGKSAGKKVALSCRRWARR